MSVFEPEGLLILDKPAGITSHDCVGAMRRLFGTRKVGHTGTLDPMATGVLPILFGRAAKAAEFLVSEDKHYEAVLRLGLTTDTEDVTGETLTTSDQIPDEEAVQAVLVRFVGEIMQVPPMYSALKQDGRKLCDLAREGITVEREARPITVFSLVGTKLSDTDYTLDVRCSKGTYIRTLCADIGAALGCGGAMAALRRVGTGAFDIDKAYTIEALEAMTKEERYALLLPTEALFSDCRAVTLPPFFERLADNGQPIWVHKLKNKPEGLSAGEYLRICGEEKGFFALGQVQSALYDNGEERLCIRPVKKFVL